MLQFSPLIENLLKDCVRFAGRGYAGRFRCVAVSAVDFQRELVDAVIQSTLPHPSLLEIVVQALFRELRLCVESLQWTPGTGSSAHLFHPRNCRGEKKNSQ